MKTISFKKIVAKNSMIKVPNYTIVSEHSFDEIVSILKYKSDIKDLILDMERSLNVFQRLFLYLPISKKIKFNIKISKNIKKSCDSIYDIDKENKIITLYQIETKGKIKNYVGPTFNTKEVFGNITNVVRI